MITGSIDFSIKKFAEPANRPADRSKPDLIDQPEAKVHLGRAWRIEFSYT
jgi:hypothetical protein